MVKNSQNERPPGKFDENRAVSEVRTGSYPGENRLVGSIGQDKKMADIRGWEQLTKMNFSQWRNRIRQLSEYGLTSRTAFTILV